MANTVTIHTKTVDDGGLVKLRGQFDSLGKGMASSTAVGVLGAKALGFGLGLIHEAADGLVNVVFDSIKAFNQEQESISRLGASLKANVPNWDGNTAAIEKTVSAQKALGFTDEEQRTSLALLVAATHDVTKAQQLQLAAMDLARFKGISLADASSALTSIEAGRARGLAQLGINVKNYATTEERVAAVEKVAAGQAADFAATNEGKLLVSQVKVNDAMEKLGSKVAGPFADGIATAADAVGFLVDAFSTLGDVAQSIADPIDIGIAQAIKDIIGLNDFVGSIPGPWHNASAAVHENAGKMQDDIVGLGRAADDAALSADQSAAVWHDAAANMSGDLARAYAMMGASKNGAALAAAAHRAGLLAEDAFAQGITDRRQAPLDAFAKLVEDLKHPLSAAKETARLIGELTSQSMADGLKSRDQVIHDQALYTKGLIIQELEKIAPQGGKLSKDAAAAVAKGLKSKDPDIRAASQAIYDRVHGIIQPLATDAYTWGLDIAKGFARGLSSDAAVKAVKAGAYVPAAAAAAIISSAGAAWHPAPTPKPHRAGGGPIAKDDLYMVGENGPEWFVSDKAGAILPHGTGPKMGSGTGGGPAGPGGMDGGGGSVAISLYWQTVYPPTPAQAQQLGRLVVPAIAQEFVRRGLIPRRSLSGVTG